MADTVSVTQAVLLRAFKLVDGIAGEINGVPNEPTDDMADDIAMDLAEALGVPFDEHWPEAAAEALASTQPAPAFPREEAMNALWHGQQDHLRARGMGGCLGDLPQSRTDLRAMYGAMLDRLAALLQGKHP